MSQDGFPVVPGTTRRVFMTSSARLLGGAAVLGGTGSLISACGGDEPSGAEAGGGGSGEVIVPRIASSTGVIPIFVQQAAGPLLYGSEFGLDVPEENFVVLQSHTVATQTVLSGDADVISGSVFGVMAAVTQGLPVKMFGGARNRDDVLAALPPVTKFEDIFREDVRVTVDSKGGTASAELQALMDASGSDAAVGTLPGITILESSGQRQAALAAGQVEAAIMHIDQFWAVQEERPEAKIIARSVDIPVFPIAVYAGLEPWLDKNQATATALVNSVTACCKAFNEDFNEFRTAVERLVEEPPPQDQLRRLHEFAVENEIWPVEPLLTEDAFKLAADLATKAEVFIEPPTYEDSVDLRAMQAATA